MMLFIIANWVLYSGRNLEPYRWHIGGYYSQLGFVLWPEHRQSKRLDLRYYSQLGFVLWPEHRQSKRLDLRYYSQLGFVLWPELPLSCSIVDC